MTKDYIVSFYISLQSILNGIQKPHHEKKLGAVSQSSQLLLELHATGKRTILSLTKQVWCPQGSRMGVLMGLSPLIKQV